MRSSVGSAAKAGLAGGQTSESSSMPAEEPPSRHETQSYILRRQTGLRPLEERLLSSFDIEKSCRAIKTPTLLLKKGRR